MDKKIYPSATQCTEGSWPEFVAISRSAILGLKGSQLECIAYNSGVSVSDTAYRGQLARE